MADQQPTHADVSKRFTFYGLVATVVVIGFLFYRVIEPFILALLFALVLAVLFKPLHLWVAGRLGDHFRTAAALTTGIVLILILLPLGGALVLAGMQLMTVTEEAVQLFKDPEKSKYAEDLKQLAETRPVKSIERFVLDLPLAQRKQAEEAVRRAADGFVSTVSQRTLGLVGDAVQFVLGMLVTAMALFYFLADSKTLVREAKRLLPLEAGEEEALADKFGEVCRGVVLGTVVAALVQAGLAGVGYIVAGVPNVLLMIALTMACAFIPFVGSTSVVMLVAAWLLLQERYGAATAMAVYGGVVVSTSDNLVRAYVIGSEAKLNPLVALITVLGALQLIGLWGIFVGPMIAAFFYTLLKLLRERIQAEELADAEPRT